MDEKIHELSHGLYRVATTYRSWRTSADLRGEDHEETERRAIAARAAIADVREGLEALARPLLADLEGE